MALSERGDLYSWGANSHGQLGNGTKVNQPSPGAVGREIGRLLYSTLIVDNLFFFVC